MALSAHDLQKKLSNGKGPPTPKKYSNINLEASGVERIRVDDESDVDKIYQMGEVLGKGAFGVVRLVTHRETKDKYAMKIVPKNKVGNRTSWYRITCMMLNRPYMHASVWVGGGVHLIQILSLAS